MNRRVFATRTAALVLALAAGIACLWAAGSVFASEPDNKPSYEFARSFFAAHCQTCHTGKEPKGDFDIGGLTADFLDKANRDRWLEVLARVKSGEMPPKEKTRPPRHDVAAVADWIGRKAADAQASDGRVVLRRLNRNEYQNTVRDLLAVDVDLKEVLPEDLNTSGFDTSAESLHVSSFLMASYLDAADRVLDLAIARGGRPPLVDRRLSIKDERSVKPTGSVYRHVDDGVAIFSSWVSANIQVTLWQFNSRHRGHYRFRISAYGFQTDKPVTFHVLAGPLNAAAQQELVDHFTVGPGEPQVIEFVRLLEPQQTIRIVTDGLGVTPPTVQKVGADKYDGPGLVVQWVDVEGPLLASWPPPSHRRIFGDLPRERVADSQQDDGLEVVSQQPLADAERILKSFARRAFRRAVTDTDVAPFVARVRTRLEQGDSFEQAVCVGLQAVLISPHFLFLREKKARPGESALDDFALASRLSYFLWSSMPDDELLALAEQGKLHEPAKLREQVERLLRDPKAAAFTQNFAGQWLSLRSIDATMPDRMLYPEHDDVLQASMVKEVLLFFDEVLHGDLSLTNFVASDFSILNGRLARHYDIPGVEGELEFRKVALPPESHRGGVLTMAAVLKVTANGTTTSPILRGAWVLDRILGTPPPKPTVDVEAIEPDIRGATTIRAQLAKHRQDPACASCHVKIDPPGFALENFDVIGGWREHYRSIGDGEPVVLNGRRVRYLHGPVVDAADVLEGGRRFENIDEFKRLLLEDKDQLARALAEKLLAYGTGAAPTATDQPDVERIVAQVREKDYGFRSLMHEVVQSQTFQRK
jgi:mono/diheme cytochrome c family protein